MAETCLISDLNEKPPAKGTTARLVLARNLRLARKKFGISQRKLAEVTGVSQSQISQIERGVHSVAVDTVERLATPLGAPMASLFDPFGYMRGLRSDLTEKPPANGTTARLVLARNLRLARNKVGTSQRKLAEVTGVSQSHISQIERGVHSVAVDTVEKLATTLGCTMSSLFDLPAFGQGN